MAGLTKIKSDGIGDDCDFDGEGTLVLDSTNNRVGIGSLSPSEQLEISSTGASALSLYSADTSISGTQEIGVIYGKGLDSGSSGPYTGAKIAFTADGTWDTGTPTYYPTAIKFYTQQAVGTDTIAAGARMVINSSGQLGIGVSSVARGPVHVHSSSSDNYFHLTNSTTGSGANDGFTVHVSGNDTLLNNREAGNLRLYTSATERMRIDSSGKVGTFAAASSDAMHISSGQSAGTTYEFLRGMYSGTTVYDGTLAFRVFTNGNIQNTNNSYGAISDAKLKENIVDASSQWDDLKAIQIRNYNFIEGQTHTQIGVVAQEVETVSPGLVTESPDRDEDNNDLGTVTKSVNYSVLYMKAVKALQEAMTRIETLEAEVAALKSN